MHWIHEFERTFLGEGVEPSELNLLQMTLRAVILFTAAIIMLRVAHKRFFAERNAIDVLLVLLLASTLSRAINGPAPLWETIAIGFVMVYIHKALTWTSCHYHGFGRWLKGVPYVLVENGKMHRDVMFKHHVSEHDLEEDVRLSGGVEDISRVKTATLERSGEISVLKQPQVLTVAVENGVQTIKIQMGG
jgi:uncharacterized membrane protein YcaP (DUF421 family)